MKDQDTRSIRKTTSTATCGPLFLARRALKHVGLTAAVIGALQCTTSGLFAAMFAISQDGTGFSTLNSSGSVVQRFGVGSGFTDLAQVTAKPTTGTWTPLANQAPGAVNLMLLLSDGSVMAQNGGGTNWYKLTPDSLGSYVKGTWTTLAPMRDSRLWYSSDVLRDGRVFVAGGEYGTGASAAEVYDPLRNAWTAAPPSSQTFVDSVSKVLPDGNVLVAPVSPNTGGATVIYNPTLNTWSNAGQLCRGYDQDEASWVKLPDESILTIDPFGTNSERYIPSLNRWISDAALPVALYNNLAEMGTGLLLADGRAFFLGGTGHTVLYTPSGNTNQGAWAPGPDIPGGLGTSDAPAAMMVNGKILCAVGNPTNYDAPTSFYEYDPVANSFKAIHGPTGVTDNVSPYATKMLDLPDGTVLYSHFGTDLYVYQPAGSPLAAGKPAISNIVRNTDGSYHLAGTGLNGISEGAAYGDDAQMDSNYPLVRLTDTAGYVYYARTYNWNCTGVMTGNRPVTTEFVLPVGMPAGAYSLVVAANGISSDPVPLTVPFTVTPPPSISITRSGASVIISWPSWAQGFTLQSSTDLSSRAAWTSVLLSAAVIGNQYSVTVPATQTEQFFRLVQQ